MISAYNGLFVCLQGCFCVYKIVFVCIRLFLCILDYFRVYEIIFVKQDYFFVYKITFDYMILFLRLYTHTLHKK